MIRNCKRGNVSTLREDYVTTFLSRNLPSQMLEGTNYRLADAGLGLAASDWYFNLADRDCRRKALLRAYCETFFDRVRNVRLSFDFCAALTYAARNRRAFRNVHAVFILVNTNWELHTLSCILAQVKNPIPACSWTSSELHWIE